MRFLKYLSKKFLKSSDFDYKDYWEKRYLGGGNSGAGSYGELAKYKANFLNSFVRNNRIKTIIEFGCGDGNQLSYSEYPRYLGLDISQKSIDLCRHRFQNDESKSFIHYDPKYFFNNGFINSELVICIDVLYHIINNEEFFKTLEDIFSCSVNFIILYTTLNEEKSAIHIKHRETLTFLENHYGAYSFLVYDNPYKKLTSAHFIVIERKLK